MMMMMIHPLEKYKPLFIIIINNKTVLVMVYFKTFLNIQTHFLTDLFAICILMCYIYWKTWERNLFKKKG